MDAFFACLSVRGGDAEGIGHTVGGCVIGNDNRRGIDLPIAAVYLVFDFVRAKVARRIFRLQRHALVRPDAVGVTIGINLQTGVFPSIWS